MNSLILQKVGEKIPQDLPQSPLKMKEIVREDIS